MSSIMEKNDATINFWMEKQRKSQQVEEDTRQEKHRRSRQEREASAEAAPKDATKNAPTETPKDAGVPKFTSQVPSAISTAHPPKQLAVKDVFVPVDNWGIRKASPLTTKINDNYQQLLRGLSQDRIHPSLTDFNPSRKPGV